MAGSEAAMAGPASVAETDAAAGTDAPGPAVPPEAGATASGPTRAPDAACGGGVGAGDGTWDGPAESTSTARVSDGALVAGPLDGGRS